MPGFGILTDWKVGVGGIYRMMLPSPLPPPQSVRQISGVSILFSRSCPSPVKW